MLAKHMLDYSNIENTDKVGGSTSKNNKIGVVAKTHKRSQSRVIEMLSRVKHSKGQICE